MTRHPLTVDEDLLFERWKTARGLEGKFVTDGVAYPDRYLKSPVKVLLILKEPYSEKRGWDLRAGLREHLETGKTWNNASRWATALQRLPTPPSWAEVEHQRTEIRRASLGGVAVINLKKVVGRARSKASEIKQFVQGNREFLREQIALYSPDVTLLCGTAAFIGHLYTPDEQGVRSQDRGLPSRSGHALGCMIRFCHPQQRTQPDQSLYERLAAGARDAYARSVRT